MIFDILTLFPDICRDYCRISILGRAQQAGLITVRAWDIREHAHDRHRTVDDAPYGGGDGMVMMAPPVVEAIESLPSEPPGPVVALTPRGRVFDQNMASEFSKLERLILLCGRYEGFDERVHRLKVDQEVSLGDFVLSGGELPALCLVEAVSRLIPGVLGGADSAARDSFSDGLLEHPHYTRPPLFRDLAVPDVLTSGNHAAIDAWRREQSLRATAKRRPELLDDAELTADERSQLEEIFDDPALAPKRKKR
jgi:tRNA (guanine37-N1)-methyltransferase